MRANAKPRVVVAMSGGVDSSLTAALLVRKGYDVIGVTMQIWEAPAEPERRNDPEHRGCCSLSAVDDARQVADKLGIPYYVLNFRQLFKETVVNYFINEYLAGKTPNPCIACNRHVKFAGLLERARALGADYVATGHYARITYDGTSGRYFLRKGIDSTKDQSYALYHLNQTTLKHFQFPLGNMTKKETRRLAKDWGLAVAEKPDSQEICFIPDNDYRRFLAAQAPDSLHPGNIVDSHGKILGRHEGLGLYTIGQRKGLGIAVGEPRYVIALDRENNRVVVGTNREVFAGELTAGDLNFIAGDRPQSPVDITAKIRYNAAAAPAVLIPGGQNSVRVVFNEPQRAVTPGQSVVFYQGDIVLGGGIIEKVNRP